LDQIRVNATGETLLAAIVFLLALGIAVFVSRQASHLGLVDVPNERSSHSTPTPRGGGLGIFIAVTLGVGIWSTSIHAGLLWKNILMGGAAVALIGLWDDVRSVSAHLRFSVHLVAAALLVWAFPGDSSIELAPGLSLGGLPLLLLACAGVVCLINVFNFMDGIDGIAASEAVFVTGGGALILLLMGAERMPVVIVCVLLCAASLGFLLVNWAPARIFMGDVGSGFLGFSIAAVALWTMVERLMPFWAWLILGGAFIADSAVTFFRRLLRGENVASAHRMHAYQRLARRWSSHSRVTLSMTAINCFWLFPLAMVATAKPLYAPIAAGIAIIPLGIAGWAVGAGLPD
jgi:Fuc2NAc and GlcNAc transferase